VRKTKYTREVLAPVVAKARSLSDVIRAFGVKPTGGTHRYFKARIARAGLDTSHFGGRSPFRTMTREQLESMVRAAKSFAQILRMLNLPEVGRPHHDLKRRVAALALDTSHFRGSGWSRGETRESHPSVEHSIAARSLSDDDAFSATSTVAGENLKARFAEGVGVRVSDLWDLRMARDTALPSRRSHQRSALRQPVGEPSVSMSELSFADADLLPPEQVARAISSRPRA